MMKRIHLIFALITALPLFVAGATGTILVFFKPADYIINRALVDVKVQGEKLPLDTLIAKIHAEHPELKVTGASFPRHPDRAFQFWAKVGGTKAEEDHYWSIYIDPYTGTISEAHDTEKLSRSSFIGWVTSLHYSLRAGETGEKYVGFSAMFLLISIGTGLYLWWPKTVSSLKYKLKPKVAKRWKQNAYTWHSMFGFYLGLGLFFVALTGGIMAFNSQLTPIFYFLTASEAPKEPQPIELKGGESLKSIEELSQIALTEAKAHIKAPVWFDYIAFPDEKNGLMTVYLQESDELYAVTNSRISLDARDGSILQTSFPDTRNRGEKLLDWTAAVHFGTWGDAGGTVLGWIIRILWIGVALLSPFLIVTGFTIWKKHRWFKNKFQKPSTQG